jgi:hypothetical protein
MQAQSPRPLLLTITLMLSTACGGTDAVAPGPDPGGAAAAAATPTATTFEVPYEFPFSCPGFDAVNRGIASGRQTLFYSEGVPVRSLLHLALRGSITNLSTGKSLSSSSDFTITTDLLTGESSVAGGQFHLVAQGRGIVVLDAGTVRFDAGGSATFEGGQHDFVNNEDIEASECEALS